MTPQSTRQSTVRSHNELSSRQIAILRLLLGCLTLAGLAASYVQRHPPKLSDEATQYQQVVWQTMSGIDIRFVLQKVCWALGIAAEISGAALMWFRRVLGLSLFIASPVLLVSATLLGAAPSAYPDVQNAGAFLAWCVTSALWGGVVAYASVRRDTLFYGTARAEMQSC